jgi:pSer/pThr/pTyr-binding forkhead associated (FHA) protein
MQYDLRFVRGHNVGRSVVVAENQRLVLGRSRDTHVNFQDPLVSRQHCEISNSQGKLSIFDLKSWNGTYVNGSRIDSITSLREGDRVTLGKSLFEVRSRNLQSNGTTKIEFSAEGSTQEGWRPEKGLPEPAKVTGTVPPCGSHSWSPNMVRGYHINGKLGEGSVGTVFSATAVDTKKTVALKIIDPNYISKDSGAKRFQRAVDICKDIRHPNVIRIYDAGESEGVYYVAMEYIAGKEVGTIIQQYGHLSVATALQIGIQITAALQYAYERSIIHRDIKPRNIMVTRRGVAKLVDFGLAKRLYRPMQSVVTMPGEAVGTLAYMPPEQIDDAVHADHRSDIYSLGASLYHMLSGKHPFDEGSFAEFVTAVMEKSPTPVHEIKSTIPPELSQLIATAMEKDPDARHQTPAHFGNALRALAIKHNCLGRVGSSTAKTMRLGRSKVTN